MIKVPVNFKRTEDAVEFVKIANEYPFQMDLASGSRIVDAKVAAWNHCHQPGGGAFPSDLFKPVAFDGSSC